MSRRLLAILWVTLVVGAECGMAQVREVEDFSCPATELTRLRTNFVPGSWNEPRFVGDLNGDGREDFLEVTTTDETPEAFYGSLVFGSGARVDDATLRSVVKSSIEYPQDTGVFSAAGLRHWAGVGDLDGDGFDDLLLGGTRTDFNGVIRSGTGLILFGRAEFPDKVDLAAPEASGLRSLRLVSTESERYLGLSVYSAGDINGDGQLDIAIDASQPGTESGQELAGRVYVIYGGFDLHRDILITEVGKSVPGFVLHGAYGHGPGHNSGDDLGLELIAPGDTNGDGVDDLVVAAERATRGGIQERGALYVVYGGPSIPGDLYIARPGEFGAELLGVRYLGYLGTSLAAVGDVDGDGLADFVAGAPGPTDPVEAFLIYGSSTWSGSASLDAPGLRHLRLSATMPVYANYPTYLGSAVSGIGDWNGDGYSDFAVGAPWEGLGYASSFGSVYIVYGGPTLPKEALDVDVGTPRLPGRVLRGPGPYSGFGSWLHGPADFDGDGRGDILVTAGWRGPAQIPVTDASSIYILYGSPSSEETLQLCAVDPPQGKIAGGYRVRLKGAGFHVGDVVRFGGIAATEVEVVSSAEAWVVVPQALQAGSVDVAISHGGPSASLQSGFLYYPDPPYEDLILDDATLRSGRHRTLVIRDGASSVLSFSQRDFANRNFGDVNGDGRDDLIVAAPFDGPNGVGEVSILFGASDLPSELEWSDMARLGTSIQGEPGFVRMGITLAVLPDTNGDGFPELALGGAVRPGTADPDGRAYVLFGRERWEPSVSLEEEVAAGRAVVMPNSECGFPILASPGNLEGRGFPAILLGQTHCEGARGTVRLYLDGFDPALSPLAPSIVITGDPTLIPVQSVQANAFARIFGQSVSGTGDINGDGLRDFAIGAYHINGEVYLVLGGEWNFREASINELLDMGRAVRVRREQEYSDFGLHVASAGDFNADGLGDVVLGLERGGLEKHGEAFVLLGSRGFGDDVLDIDLREMGAWMRVKGEYPYDFAGYVAGLGDWNGDGYGDVGILGTCERNRQARAYVLLGEAKPPAEISLGDLRHRGFRITGAEGHWFSAGLTPIAAGDLDGDGLRDLALGEMTPEGKRVVVIFGRREGAETFIRGEVNGDGKVDLSDAVATLGYLFLGNREPICLDAADEDDSGKLGITDAIFLLGALFLGSNTIPAPYPSCGPDPTPDDLGCRQSCR